MLNNLRSLFFSKYVLVVTLLLIYLGIGAFYAGGLFLSNISTAVPRHPSGGSEASHFMLPGDHFEQLYRYSLPKHNLEKNRPLYESGYQYNFTSKGEAFSEGWIFFPFSLLHLVLATIFGHVASYNLIALMSFPLVGGAMYLLVFWLIRSHPAALLSSLVLALLPHRTSFLFSEMVYGVDLMWPPLIVLFFEKSIRTLALRYILVFGVCLLLYATSNFQAFYLFSLFSLPYFAGRSIQVLMEPGFPMASKLRAVGLVLLALLPVLLYLHYIGNLLSMSGLSSGQNYIETQFHSPLPDNMFQVWSGNEKSVYLGWVFLTVPIFLIVFGVALSLRKVSINLSRSDITIFILSGVVFVISYLFCFGPNLDSILNVKMYHWYFDHIPGANSTRTPGRLMNTAGFYFALFFGFLVHLLISMWKSKSAKRSFWVWGITVTVAILIIFDYNYTRPLMVRLETNNDAYETIRGAKGIIYTIPNQVEATHYFNATFLYYAQKYDLRLFTGHSSMYPKEWNRIIRDFLPVNKGRFDREMMERFKGRGITHLVAHATGFEPNVDPWVIMRLKQSPYLNLIAEANGVYVFHVDVDASGKQGLDIERLVAGIQLTGKSLGKFHFLDGWYPREAYPSQRPFRWMHGINANGVIIAGKSLLHTMEFAYRCPLQGLGITINGIAVQPEPANLGEGWKKQVIDLTKYGKTYFYVEFFTPKIFKSSPDIRDFGCLIGDISVR
jgi:hypothetical protein